MCGSLTRLYPELGRDCRRRSGIVMRMLSERLHDHGFLQPWNNRSLYGRREARQANWGGAQRHPSKGPVRDFLATDLSPVVAGSANWSVMSVRRLTGRRHCRWSVKVTVSSNVPFFIQPLWKTGKSRGL